MSIALTIKVRESDLECVGDSAACDKHKPEKSNLQFSVELCKGIEMKCAQCGEPATLWTFYYAVKEQA